MIRILLFLVGLTTASGGAAFETLDAELLREYDAPLARQGVTVDAISFFAISDTAVARHARRGGREIARWQSVGRAGVAHLGGCVVTGLGELVCANSNFPARPTAGSIEWFDPATLAPKRSRSLGPTDGVLVWIDELADGWLAGFAHSTGPGDASGRDARHTRIVRYDRYWIEQDAWLLPEPVYTRLGPRGLTGGSVGPEGLLYVGGDATGELHALARPAQGPILVHVASVGSIEADRAFAWDRDGDERLIWSMLAGGGTVAVYRVPEVVVPAGLRRFATLDRR